MTDSVLRRVVLPAAVAVAATMSACGGMARGPTVATPPTSTVRVGECGDPARDGVLGAAPALRHADRDLNGDGIDEVVVADSALCNREGDCHWNVFVGDDAAGCRRYAGTIQAIGIERLSGRGDAGFADLRAVWQLTGGDRFLVQEYRFRRGGYQVTDAVLCRQLADDRVLCASEPQGR